jgi:hypothetical protein
MEADLHSRGSISVVHELEVAAYGNHGMPPPMAQLLPLPAGCAQASNTTVPLGTDISLPVDDVLARMSPNTPVEDALLDLYLMLLEADHLYTSSTRLLASWKSTLDTHSRRV